MIAYKVFKRNSENQLISAGDIPDEFKLIYSEEGINYPKIEKSKLFVFRDIDNAENYKTKNTEIWMVDVGDITIVDRLPILWFAKRLCSKLNIKEEELCSLIKNYWENKQGNDNLNFLSRVVSGVYMTDWVKLIAKI